jgi:hypothetical protein
VNHRWDDTVDEVVVVGENVDPLILRSVDDHSRKITHDH